MPTHPILFVRQRHDAKRAGLHNDYRVVIGDKAFSWASKKDFPKTGKPTVLWEQPVHDAAYATSPRIEIPEGQYGAGVTTLDYAQKGVAEVKDGEYHLDLNNGESFLIKRSPTYGDKAWIFIRKSKNRYLEKSASMYERAKYQEGLHRLPKGESTASSVKYDGANFFLAYDHNGVPSFVSRKKSVKGTPIYKTDRVPHLSKTLPSQANKVFNLELIHTGHHPDNLESHARVSGLLNALPERSIREQNQDGPIRAVVFDLIHPKAETFEEKQRHVQSLIKDFGDEDLMFSPEWVYGHKAMEELAEKTAKEGREGIIAVDTSKPENGNPRVKLKHVNQYNLKVRDILQEYDIHGRPKESAGALLLEDATGREVGKVGTGFDRRTREDIWRNKKDWLAKLIQVKAMKPTASKLRSAVYNGDADGGLDTV